MSSLRFNPASAPQGLYDVSATQLAPLGSELHLGDGRVFVYCEAGGTALTVGRLVQSEAVVGNHGGTGLATTNGTGLIGTRTITVTLGATAAAENLYAEGYLLIVNDTGAVTIAGSAYKIAGHPAIASAGTGVITTADPFWESLSDDSTVALVKHPCKDIIITVATTPTEKIVGVPIRDVPLDNFAWIQRRGICAVLQDVAWVNGNPVTVSDTVAGAAGPLTATQAIDEPQIGVAVSNTATADLGVIFLEV